ncbi:MAG: tyrosine transporter [Parachlamydiales bacterium]|nr:tyrosine transporter [Parachlamydiales bacterium]
MSTNKSQFLGGTLLIAGCCIGAAMLGLPIITGRSGFGPAIVAMIFAWLFMLATGLLLLEVNLSLGKQSGIISMAEHTLGRLGKTLSWVFFLFLFYCLMVAYVAGSGSLIQGIVKQAFNVSIPGWVGSLGATALFGAMIVCGTSQVDTCNRYLMIGKGISYILLLTLGFSAVDGELLAYHEWNASLAALPILVVSFGYHNMVPSLTRYFNGNANVLKKVIIVGSALPLLIYALWEALVLGIIPVAGLEDALGRGDTAAGALQLQLGISRIATIGQYFAFFALATSFLAVALSFVHFLGDGFKYGGTKKQDTLLTLAVLGPSFIFALMDPTIFLTALNYAGGIGAVILFGVMPALMAWNLRYRKKTSIKPILPGGKVSLIIVMTIAVSILVLQILSSVGVNI